MEVLHLQHAGLPVRHTHTHTHTFNHTFHIHLNLLAWVCAKSSTAEGGTESLQMSAPVPPVPSAPFNHIQSHCPLSPGSEGAQARSKPCGGWDVIRTRLNCVVAKIVLHSVSLLLTPPPPPVQGHRGVTSRTSRLGLGSQRTHAMVPVACPLLLGFLLPRKGRNRALVMPACSTA